MGKGSMTPRGNVAETDSNADDMADEDFSGTDTFTYGRDFDARDDAR